MVPYLLEDFFSFFFYLTLSATLPRSLRYVNCAHNDEEQNLVAFQYRGEILYRCCRPIDPGQELLMWYEEEYPKDQGPTFAYLWNQKCSANGKVQTSDFIINYLVLKCNNFKM